MSDVGRGASTAPDVSREGSDAVPPGRPRGTPRGAASLARRRLALWGGTVLCLGWLSHGWEVSGPGLATRAGRPKGDDYIQFYVMGSRVHEGRGELLYDMEAISAYAKRRISPRLEYHPDRNPYGPQVALAFAPLARVPFLTSLAVFSLLSLGAYAAAVWVLWRQAPGLAGDGRYVALLAAAWPALLVTLRFGQISTLTLLGPALALAALAKERRFLAGVCLGLLAYKPQLLVVTVPMLLVARDWRGLGGVLAAAAAQLAIAWAGRRHRRDAAIPGDAQGAGHAPRRRHAVPREFTFAAWIPAPARRSANSGNRRRCGARARCTPALARVWRGGAPPLLRVSLLLLLTLLLTPHVLTYDLLLLAVPIIGLAEWATRHYDDAHASRAIVVAVALYCAPYSPVIADHAHVQLSTLAMAAGAWMTWRLWRGVVRTGRGKEGATDGRQSQRAGRPRHHV